MYLRASATIAAPVAVAGALLTEVELAGAAWRVFEREGAALPRETAQFRTTGGGGGGGGATEEAPAAAEVKDHLASFATDTMTDEAIESLSDTVVVGAISIGAPGVMGAAKPPVAVRVTTIPVDAAAAAVLRAVGPVTN